MILKGSGRVSGGTKRGVVRGVSGGGLNSSFSGGGGGGGGPLIGSEGNLWSETKSVDKNDGGRSGLDRKFFWERFLGVF
jgi:hypothetical protein